MVWEELSIEKFEESVNFLDNNNYEVEGLIKINKAKQVVLNHVDRSNIVLKEKIMGILIRYFRKFKKNRIRNRKCFK